MSREAQEEDRREEAWDLELLEEKVKREELKEQLFEYLNIWILWKNKNDHEHKTNAINIVKGKG